MPATAEVIQFPSRKEEAQEGRDSRLWDHAKLKQSYRDAEEAHQEPRRLAFRDRDYYDNFNDDQWTEYEKKKLAARRQQIVTSNKIKRKVNGILGIEQKQRSDPKAYPKRPDQSDAADVATEVLDYIENDILFDRIASCAAKDMAISGIEAVEMMVGGDRADIEAEHITFDRFFYDPRSMKEDFSDARYMGYAEWMDADVAKAKYPDKEKLVSDSLRDFGGYDEGYEDKPWGVYADKANERVRVVVIYYKTSDGAWMLAHFTGAGILFETPSPWPDEQGRPACGIIAQSFYVSRKGYRFGIVRDDISTQNEINQRKSRSVHLLNDHRTWGVDGWTPDEDRAKEAMARPDGHVPVTATLGTNWGLIESTAEVQGNFELLQQAIADMELQGLFQPGSEGRLQDQSGRAIIALQQAGLTAENLFFDAHNAWKLRCYRQMWFLAKKFWQAPKWIRVSGEEEAPRLVGINLPVGVGPTGQPVIQNPIGEIDVDIQIEIGPDTLTLQHEQFEQLTQVLPALAKLPLPLAIMLLEASSLRDKRKAIESLQAFAQMQSQAAGPSPLEAAQVEADVGLKKAQTMKTQMEAGKIYAEGMAGPESKAKPEKPQAQKAKR